MKRSPAAILKQLWDRLSPRLAHVDRHVTGEFETAARDAYHAAAVLAQPIPTSHEPIQTSPSAANVAPAPTVRSGRWMPTPLTPDASRGLRVKSAPPTRRESQPSQSAEGSSETPSIVVTGLVSPAPKIAEASGAATPTAGDDLSFEAVPPIKDTAPDFLLLPPPSVTPVADAFFAGLIRRVEGDR
jgi:hypothetical protein